MTMRFIPLSVRGISPSGPSFAAEPLEPAPLVEDWRHRALCREVGPALFFTEAGESTAEAKRVCAACPVRAECLDFALEQDDRWGIWGGLDRRERVRFERERDAA
jgi:WhiB family redox-sensing transcriptional regulator